MGACIHLFFFSHQRIYIVLFGIFVLLKIWERVPVKPKSVKETKSETPQSLPDTMAARVINHRHLADKVLEYTVEIHQELVVIPGQRLLLSLEDTNGTFNRAYSVVDWEIDDGRTLLTFVAKIIGGRGTSVLATVKIGDTLHVKGIYGKFILHPTDAPKVFI